MRHGGEDVSGLVKPTTLVELQALIPRRTTVRAVAAGHSGDPWPAISYISMNAFNRPLAVTADTVTVEAGMSIAELLTFLKKQDRTIEGLPSILLATIGGVIITGGHGSGIPILASQVQHAVFVLADGRLLSVPSTEPTFTSLITSAGLIGFLYSITLRTVPSTTLYQSRVFTTLPLDPVGWLKQGLYRQLFYNPYTQHALLYDHALESKFGDDHQPLANKWLNGKRGEKLAMTVYEKFPAFVPRFTDLAYQALSGRSHGPSAEILSIPEYDIPYLDYEVAVPVAEAPQALEKLQKLVLEYRNEKKYYLWFGMFLRYLPADKSPLSMAYKNDVIAFALPLYESDESKEFVSKVQEIMGKRFHVGKYFPTSLKDHHGWKDFNGLRERLDPHNRFLPSNV